MANNSNSAASRTRGRMPTKRSINFAEVGVQKTNYFAFVPVILVVLVIGALVTKFGILDRYEEVARAEAATADLQMQLDAANARVEGFGATTDLYAQYTFSGMTDEEVSMADRVEVLDLIDRILMDRCVVKSWDLNGNNLVITIDVEDANDMRQINLLTAELKADPMVIIAEVTNAKIQERTLENSEETIMVATARLKVQLKKKEVIKG